MKKEKILTSSFLAFLIALGLFFTIDYFTFYVSNTRHLPGHRCTCYGGDAVCRFVFVFLFEILEEWVCFGYIYPFGDLRHTNMFHCSV